MKLNFNIYQKVKYKDINTTQGRILFNKQLPKGYEARFGYINYPITKKSIKPILNNVYIYFPKDFSEVVDKLKVISILYATIFNKSIPLGDLTLPDNLKQEIKQINKMTDLVDISNKIKIVATKYKSHLKSIKSPLYDLIESGASKGKIEPMVVSKGVVVGIEGDEQLIKSSLSDGFTPVEYFKSGDAARGGLADRVLNTSHTGYLERKLIYGAAAAILGDENDCKTTRTFNLVYDKKLANILIGRYFLSENDKLVEITLSNIKMFDDGDIVKLRSPMYCKNKNICHICYGRLYEKVTTNQIGVLAAQILGDRGSQAIMRSFHSGGAVEWKKINVYALLSRFNTKFTIPQLKKFIFQNDYSVSAKLDIKLVFLKKDIESYINFNDKTIDLPEINFKSIDKQGNILFWIMDVSGTIMYNEIQQEQEYYTIIKKSGELILNIIPSSLSVNYHYMRKVFEQSISSNNEHQLYYRLLDTYLQLGTIDSVHFETIISELIRDPDDPMVPYRFRKDFTKPPLIVSIKESPYLNNATLGLFFENPQRAIEYGLIQDTERETSITNLVKSF